MFAKGSDSVMEARFGGADRNLQNCCAFFEGEVVLIAEKEDGSAGGRHLVEEGKEGLVGGHAEAGVEGSEVFRRCVIERSPATGVFEMREGNPRRDAEGPGAEDGGLAQVGELAEYLERGLLEDVVGEGGASEAGDVAAQGRIGVAEKLFQCGPVAGLREQDQQSLAGRRGLHGWRLGAHT